VNDERLDAPFHGLIALSKKLALVQIVAPEPEGEEGDSEDGAPTGESS
jgi:hypothetical protein